MLCSCTDLERTASCIASAGHAWAVPVSDMREVRALRSYNHASIYSFLHIAKCISVISCLQLLKFIIAFMIGSLNVGVAQRVQHFSAFHFC